MRAGRDAQPKLPSNVDESQPPITRVCTNFECAYIATQWHAIARRSRTHARTLVFYAHDHYGRHQARSQHCSEMSRVNHLRVMPSLVRPIIAASMHRLRSILNIKGKLSVLAFFHSTWARTRTGRGLRVRHSVMPGSSSMRACIDAYSPLITFSSTHHLTPCVHAAELKHLDPQLDWDPHLDWTHTACSSGRTSLLVPFHTESRPWR